LKIGALFIILSLVTGCCKEDPAESPEVFNYNNLNGKMAFSRSSGKIIILDGDRKTDTCLTILNEETIWEASVSLSPNGESITYSANAADGYQVFKMSVNGENILKLTKSQSGFAEHYTCPVWNSDGGNIFYVANGLYILGPVYSIKPDGTDLKQITDFEVYRRVSVSRDNSFIVYSALKLFEDPPESGIYLYSIQNDLIRQIRTYDNHYTAYSPVLSPDEKKIAFVLRHGPNEQGTIPFFFRILIVNIDGTDEKLVTELPFILYRNDVYVTWSPDGTKLSFNYGSGMNDDNGSHIFIINSDGTGLTQVTSNTDYDGAPSWIN
jgi:Tol biopolymer transport system component